MFGDYFQKNTDSTNSNDAIFSIRCLVLVTRFRSQRKFLNFVYDTLHGTNIYHLGKRKLIFKTKGSFWRLFALSKRKDPNYPSGFLLQKAQIFHHAGRIRGFPDSIFWGEGTPSDRFPTLGLSKLMGVDKSWMFQGRFWMDVRALGNIPWIYPPPSNSHK